MEDREMSDFISSINYIGPAYPVKPVQPSKKDRENSNRRKQRERPDLDKPEDDSGDSPTIDEHV